MRRFMPTSWRKLAVAGVTGVAISVAFAAPALACHGRGPVAAECKTADTATVTWSINTVDNPAMGTAKVATVEVVAGEDGKTVITLDDKKSTMKANEAFPVNTEDVDRPDKSLTAVAVLTKAQLATAKLRLKMQWIKNNAVTESWGYGAHNSGHQATDGIFGISKEIIDGIDWTKCPTTPPATTTTTKAAVAAANDKLPVTGANSAVMAAVAVMLVGAGVGLFFVARRRRVRFTA